jgi:uncharacterized membrane protein YgcG
MTPTALPEKYHQIAVAIETLLNLSAMSMEELFARLKSSEERYNLGGSIAGLNLTEDELVACVAAKMQVSGEGSSGQYRGSSSPSGQRRGHGRGHGRSDGHGSSGGRGGPRPRWAGG